MSKKSKNNVSTGTSVISNEAHSLILGFEDLSLNPLLLAGYVRAVLEG